MSIRLTSSQITQSGSNFYRCLLYKAFAIVHSCVSGCTESLWRLWGSRENKVLLFLQRTIAPCLCLHCPLQEGWSSVARPEPPWAVQQQHLLAQDRTLCRYSIPLGYWGTAWGSHRAVEAQGAGPWAPITGIFGSVPFSDWSSGYELPGSSSAFSCRKTFSLGVWIISVSETFSQLSFNKCSNRLQKYVSIVLWKMFVRW